MCVPPAWRSVLLLSECRQQHTSCWDCPVSLCLCLTALNDPPTQNTWHTVTRHSRVSGHGLRSLKLSVRCHGLLPVNSCRVRSNVFSSGCPVQRQSARSSWPLLGCSVCLRPASSTNAATGDCYAFAGCLHSNGCCKRHQTTLALVESAAVSSNEPKVNAFPNNMPGREGAGEAPRDPCMQNEKCTLFAGELAAWNVRHVQSFHLRALPSFCGSALLATSRKSVSLRVCKHGLSKLS